ncbi:hypothetical protein [Halalkalicoccus sp. NIPERK01]|uniref:hypothetical protein n=1 Tax=Halalkalicoccus sp. NIPERK01 TaxID=3053469 RepID=UPI00256F481F|nr:hypothetical protein [Halalkalicoccus sp. NIPERK01]MDL5361086.1 hypothetical protein [Halalkalicoccus sp. NIPERK01]
MIPTICIVTSDPRVADRYAVALADASRRHASYWTRAALDGVDVVLFDPATVDRSTVAADREDGGRTYRAIKMDGDFEGTVERVARAGDKRRFEATIDARFDALSDDDRPAVTAPESLDAVEFGDLYEAV